MRYGFPQILRKLMYWHPMYHRRITQKELAEYVGIRPQTISQYTKGETAPSAEHLLKIADYLQVSTDYLLTGKKGGNNEKLENAIVLNSLHRVQEQLNGIVSQTNMLIAELEATE